MVLGIENSVKDLTADYVKNLLLQEKIFDKGIDALVANFGKKKNVKKDKREKSREIKKSSVIFVGKKHFVRNCPERKGVKTENALLSSSLVDQSNSDWFIDSGASTHMTNDKSILDNLRETNRKDVIVKAT